MNKQKFKEMQVQLVYQAKIKQRQRSRKLHFYIHRDQAVSFHSDVNLALDICIRKQQNAPPSRLTDS